MKKTIAIVGATGYIGRSLAFDLLQEKYSDYDVVLFARSLDKLNNLFKGIRKRDGVSFQKMGEFPEGTYDIIVNATGIGDPKLLAKSPESLSFLTEEIDFLILEYLKRKNTTHYINLSSGAVYGKNSRNSVHDGSDAVFPVNHLSSNDFYSIAKINSEAKHRAHSHLHITDIRVFAFFSHLVDLQGSFLMSEIAKSIKEKSIFVTSSLDIVRDYITPQDLLTLLFCVIDNSTENTSFDVYSKSPVSKFEILKVLKDSFQLSFQVTENLNLVNSQKNSYFSENHNAHLIGYDPVFTSLEGILFELKRMLK